MGRRRGVVLPALLWVAILLTCVQRGRASARSPVSATTAAAGPTARVLDAMGFGTTNNLSRGATSSLLRFSRAVQEQQAGQGGSASVGAKVAVCAKCLAKITSSSPDPEKPFSKFEPPTPSDPPCGPPTAMCRFCMDAAYAGFWGTTKVKSPKQRDPHNSRTGGVNVPMQLDGKPEGKAIDICDEYPKAVQMTCKKVVKDLGDVSTKMGKLYMENGPTFGASAVICKEGGCCVHE